MKAGNLSLVTESPVAPTQLRDVEFIDMPVKQILNRCSNPRLSFRWTINPYRGCEFGCLYCYARYTHEFLDLRDPMDFERRIFIKRQAAEALARNLTRTAIGTDQIALGTATDPYQPAERKFGLTRSILEVLARFGGMNLSITTKSALIVRDLDLLTAINQHSKISVNFSLITLNRRLQRLLEPRAPRPSLRLDAIRRLTDGGIRCNVLMMPMIPGITDQVETIEQVIRAARKAGATEVWWRSLFLKPAAARRFIPFAQETFPSSASRINDYYGRHVYAPASYDAYLQGIFDRLRRKYGFAVRGEADRAAPSVTVAATSATQGSFDFGIVGARSGT